MENWIKEYIWVYAPVNWIAASQIENVKNVKQKCSIFLMYIEVYVGIYVSLYM